MSFFLKYESNFLTERFFFLLHAALAMAVLNLISRVHLHATQTVEIFHILQLLLIYHNLYWG
jgi:hypothetical protein